MFKNTKKRKITPLESLEPINLLKEFNSSLSYPEIYVEELNTFVKIIDGYLNLANKNLTKIPKNLGNYYITDLNLNFNNIKTTENLEECILLKKLNIGHNKLEKIENIENLVNLDLLYLGNNFLKQIQNLPKNISCLDLENNFLIQIKNLPEKLILLNVENNNLISIKELYECKNLKFLLISGNKIKDMKCCTNFTHLKVLSIERTYVDMLYGIYSFEYYENSEDWID